MRSTITIPDDLVNAIDQITGRKDNIEKLIELLLREYLTEEKKKQQSSKDLKILRENSKFLNREAQDVLDYQVNL